MLLARRWEAPVCNQHPLKIQTYLKFGFCIQGGTIASKVDYVTGAVAARFEPEELLDAVPELAQHARIRAKKLGNMWSDDIRPRHWNAMMAEQNVHSMQVQQVL